MALKVREELVGKRFLSLLKGEGPGRTTAAAADAPPPLRSLAPPPPPSEWDWRSGVIRASACSVYQQNENDARVLVEYDNTDWQLRKWIRIKDVFQVFLVEETLAWIPYKANGHASSSKQLYPALTFRPLLDKSGLTEDETQSRPVEFLVDKRLAFISRGTALQVLKEVDLKADPPMCDDPVALDCVRQWIEFQDGQQILLKTPSVLVGYRVQVYRSEGTTQWYTAVIKSYNENNQTLDVTDDTVLEEHQVNPTLVQMNLLGDGVISSILRGEDSGIRQSRTRRCSRLRYNSTSSGPLNSTSKASKKKNCLKDVATGGGGGSLNCKSVLGGNIGVVIDDFRKSSSFPGRTANHQEVICRKDKPLDISTPPSLPDSPVSLKISKTSGIVSRNTDSTASQRKKQKKCKRDSSPDETLFGKSCKTYVADDLDITKLPSIDSASPAKLDSPVSLSHSESETVSTYKSQIVRSDSLRINISKSPSKTVVQETCKATRNEATNAESLTTEGERDTEPVFGLPDASNSMPKVKSAAMSAEHHNSSEAQGADERREFLKSVGAINSAMMLTPQSKTVANHSVPSGYMNLTAKASEVRKHLLPGIKTGDSGELNFSGLNLNQSVTDQITHRSREKLNKSMTVKSASNSILNSAAEVKCESPAAREFHELNKRGSPNFSVGVDMTANQTTTSSAHLQQRNSKIANNLGHHNESSPTFANSKHFKTSTPNLHPVNEMPSRSVGAVEMKASPTQSNVSSPNLASVVETVARQNLALNAFPCRLPLLNQATAAAAAHQLSRVTPSTVNQPIPINSFFLLQAEQRLLMEKLLQTPATSSGSGAILAACPPYLANIISMRPELLWLQYHEIQREALRQQQQQQQQQLSNHASEAENNESKSAEVNNSKVASDNLSLTCPENVKKEISSVNSAQPKKNPDRVKELVKETGVEYAKDPSSVVGQKRSELLLPGSISDAINQHFKESLRNVQQKTGLQPPPGRDHRLVMAQQDHLSTSVNHDTNPPPKLTMSQPTGVAMASAEHPFYKDNRIQKGGDIASSTAPGLLNQAHSGAIHLMQDKPTAAPALNATGAAAVFSTAAPSASLISSTTSNLMKKEPSLNLYGYQTCPVYLPNAAHMQQHSFNNDKKTMKKEPENRRNAQDKVFLSSSDISQFLSSQTVPIDESRLKAATVPGGDKSRNMVSHHHAQSPKLQKPERQDPINAATAKNPIHPSVVSGSTSEERRFEGALNYVVAATAAKGQILVPVRPASVGRSVLPNGQSKVNMPILKESLAVKPKTLSSGVPGPMMGGMGVTGRVGQMIPSIHPVSSVVTVSEQALNGLLLSLPIASAAAASCVSSSGSLSLPLNSLSLATSLAPAGTAGIMTSSTYPVCSSYSSLTGWPQIPLKRDFAMTNEARDHNMPSDSFPGDNAKRMRVDGIMRNQSPNAGPAVFCSVPGTSSAAVTCSSTSVCTSSAMMRTCNEYLRTYSEAKDYSSKTLGPVTTGSHLLLPSECDRGSVIVGHKAFEEFSVQLTRISHCIADTKQDNCQVQDLKLASSSALPPLASTRLQDYLGHPVNNETNQGADSDTLSANSPLPPSLLSSSASARPVCSEPAAQKQWQHTKFKKALLQRYSDEDMKGMPPEGTQDGSSARKLENENETTNSSVLLEERDDNNSSVGMNNDTMSAASEHESSGWISAADSVNSNRVKKKRKSNRHLAKAEPPDKARKLSDTEESTTSSSGTLTMTQKKCTTKQQHNADGEEDQIKEQGRKVAAEEQTTPEISRNQMNSLSLMNSSVFSSSSSVASQQSLPDCQSKILKRQEELKHSQCRDDPSVSLAKKKLNSSSDEQRQRTMEVFLQDDDCHKVTPKLVKCRECKMVRNKRDKRVASDFCRFYAFRRLRYSPKRFLTVAGFSEPCDADALDIELWMPMTPVVAPAVDVETAIYIILHTGDRFASLVEQEQEAMALVPPDSKIAWKQAVQGVREMCDICDATLFNVHWVCRKCGFAVCTDCFRIRSQKMSNGGTDARSLPVENHGRKWLTCSVNRQMHEPDNLMMVQIIPSDVLLSIGNMLDEIRKRFQIHSKIKTGDVVPKKEALPDSSKDASATASRDPSAVGRCHENLQQPLPAFFDLSMLAEAALAQKPDPNLSAANGVSSADLNGSADKCSTLKDLLTKTISVLPNAAGNIIQRPPGSSPKNSLEDIIHKVMKRTTTAVPTPTTVTLSYYVPRVGRTVPGRSSPMPEYLHEQTSGLFPDVLHSWLDNGRLLQLFDPQNAGNIRLFQQQWRHGQPVVVSNCDASLDRSLWRPETFSKEFGHLESPLVNCTEGTELTGQRMKKFWDGFERMSGRLKDKDGRPVVLKLKDWPQRDEFSELLPNHYQDLMRSLPLPEYTRKGGPFNLVSRLPEFFMKPDLGPKLYCAYGQAKCPDTGTTNLHQDVTDAFNLLVYIGLPKDNLENQRSAVSAALENAGCCQLTKERLKEAGTKPGALWHVFDPLDADKIRDLLNKVASERGEDVELHHDALRSQNWYLDEKLRARLLTEYGVQCYTIVQCLGDAVFIPAGAPHQVLNLNSCIKVAADFVSPENMDSCFRMTQECRQLSTDAHGGGIHEDKLQVKNILYHAVKDAIAVLRDTAPKYEG